MQADVLDKIVTDAGYAGDKGLMDVEGCPDTSMGNYAHLLLACQCAKSCSP